MALDAEAIVILAWVFALIMCFAMGSNDESMGSAYGAKIFSLNVAICVGATTEMLGSVLLGRSVTITIQRNLFDTSNFETEIDLLMLVFLCATASASLFLIIASYFGWPVSTTHGIIGAVAGAAVGAKGFDILSWDKLLPIVASWFISPLAGGVITALFYFAIELTIFNKREPYMAALTMAPYFYACGICGAASFILFDGLPLPDSVPKYWSGVIIVGLFFSTILIAKFLVVRRVGVWVDQQEALYVSAVQAAGKRNIEKSAFDGKNISSLYVRLTEQPHRKVEAVFVFLQMLTSPMVSFARGANDVSNGIGPLAAVIALDKDGAEALKYKTESVPLWVLLIGGAMIGVGLFVLGRKVIQNIGDNITLLTPSRGVSLEVGTSITVLVFSALGVPISSTHTLVGCIFAIGLCSKAKKFISARAFGSLSKDESQGLLELESQKTKRLANEDAASKEDVNWKNIIKIFASWVFTIPAAAVLAGLSVFACTEIFE